MKIGLKRYGAHSANISKNEHSTLHNKKWIINISLIVIIASTVILNGVITPSLLTIINNRDIGVTHKADGLELQTLLKGPEIPQLVFMTIHDEQDAKKMAKQYERLFFGGDLNGVAVIASKNTESLVWEVELIPQNPSGTMYDLGGVYIIQSDGRLIGFRMVAYDHEQEAALSNNKIQSQAAQAARNIIKKMGYSDDFYWTYDMDLNSFIASRLFGEQEQLIYMSFFMHENMLYLFSMKNGWRDVSK